MRALVIDDEKPMRELIQAILADAGFAVLAASNGREGLNTLAREKVDLVITDILMPVTEGVETICEIRRNHPGTRIIAISGGGRVRNLRPLQVASGAGADTMLAKPFEPGDLLAAVAKVFAGTLK